MELGTPATKVSWAHRTPDWIVRELKQDESLAAGYKNLRNLLGGYQRNPESIIGEFQCSARRSDQGFANAPMESLPVPSGHRGAGGAHITLRRDCERQEGRGLETRLL
jgi:hypothetical protein